MIQGGSWAQRTVKRWNCSLFLVSRVCKPHHPYPACRGWHFLWATSKTIPQKAVCKDSLHKRNQSCFAASCSVLQPEGKKSELIEGVLAPLFSLWLTGVCRLQEYRNTPHSVVGRRWMLYLIAHFILSDRFLPKCLSALEVFSILQLILRLNTSDSFHSLKMCCDAPLVSLQRRLRSWVSWDEAVSGRT